MDSRYTVTKTDYLVPASADYVRGPIKANISVNTYTALQTSLGASVLGGLVIMPTDSTIGSSLPAATTVTAYWGAVPGDVFTTTILNNGSTFGPMLSTDTVLGIVASVGHATITTGGISNSFQYVVGGTVAIPTASVYVL